MGSKYLMKNKKSNGFSIIELMITITISLVLINMVIMMQLDTYNIVKRIKQKLIMKVENAFFIENLSNELFDLTIYPVYNAEFSLHNRILKFNSQDKKIKYTFLTDKIIKEMISDKGSKSSEYNIKINHISHTVNDEIETQLTVEKTLHIDIGDKTHLIKFRSLI